MGSGSTGERFFCASYWGEWMQKHPHLFICGAVGERSRARQGFFIVGTHSTSTGGQGTGFRISGAITRFSIRLSFIFFDFS